MGEDSDATEHVDSAMVLPEPECPLGYPVTQLQEVLDEQQFQRLMLWMSGQSGLLCQGTRYNHDLRRHEPTECAQHPHGMVVFAWDVRRWVSAGPIID